MTARDILALAIEWFDSAEEVENSPKPAWYKLAARLLETKEDDPHHGLGRSGALDT